MQERSRKAPAKEPEVQDEQVAEVHHGNGGQLAMRNIFQGDSNPSRDTIRNGLNIKCI